MAFVYLLGLALVLWGVCGATVAIGRRVWGLDTALRVHLVAAPVAAFLVATVHRLLVPAFDSLLRAAVMTAVIIVLDAVLVAPLFERSYAMFRSLIGTWIPFALIFLASWAAGILMPA
jgi:Na+-transporting NADH:ubiquinone oxidoreductase subunit NqrD